MSRREHIPDTPITKYRPDVSESNISISSLAYWNAWWKTGEITSDPDLINWFNSTFKWKPRLIETLEPRDVIYVLRGPRRIGKTTLLKLRIKELLEGKGEKAPVPPSNIFYYPCDSLYGNSQNLPLIIDTYLDKQRKLGHRAYLFIDEVSMRDRWQNVVKPLIDANRFKDCTVVFTGSHSIDLQKSTESLAGRRGMVQDLEYGTPDKILLPAKFSEYVETLDATLRKEITDLELFRKKVREETFLALAAGTITPRLERLALFTKEINYLLDQYLLTGGIAQAVDRYLSKGTITQDTYDTFVDHLVRDLVRYGRKETLTRQIVKRIIDIIPSHTSWNRLKEGTEVKDHKTACKYVESLSETFAVTYLYQLGLDRAWPEYDKEKKIYIRDPFIFHAFRSWIYGRDAFDLSLDFLSSPINKSGLMECVVGDHLSRLMFIFHPSSRFKPSDYVFYWRNKKDQEVDFTVQIEDKFLPLEVKFKDKIKRDDTRGVCSFVKDSKSHSFGIITSKDLLKAEENYSIIPLGLLLLLI